MTFQFLCPQGHLLQGEEADMGMQCQCPQCGTAFIIPTVERPDYGGGEDLAAAPGPSAGAGQDLGFADEMADDIIPPEARRPAAPLESAPSPAPERRPARKKSGPQVGEMDFDQPAPAIGGLDTAVSMEKLLHIPCPNGHELETPFDMVGQRVLCPHCRAEFTLRREKSIEYLHEQEMLDRRRAQFWFQAAIAAAAVVGLALLLMIVLMFMS